MLQRFAPVRSECAAVPDGIDQVPVGQEQLAEGDHVEATGGDGLGRVIAAVADQGAAMVAAQEGAGAPTQKIECAVFDDARVQISDRARIESLDRGGIGVLVAMAAARSGLRPVFTRARLISSRMSALQCRRMSPR